MGQLNIRDVDDRLVRRLKSEAALNGLTLREYVLKQLEVSMKLKAAVAGKEVRESAVGEPRVSGTRAAEGARAETLTPTKPNSDLALCAEEFCGHHRADHQRGVCQKCVMPGARHEYQ